MNMRTLQRRALAWILVLVICLGMLPTTALAADQTQGDPGIRPEVTYPTVKRRAAEVTYSRPAKYSDVHLICLVDTSIDGNAAGDMAAAMSACRPLYEDSHAQGHTVTYTYMVDTYSSLHSSFSYGSGQANEVAALREVQKVLGSTVSGKRPVVFWVPSPADRIDGSSALAEIKAELGKVKAAVERQNGEIIVWQKGDKVSDWLSAYTAHARSAAGADFRTQVRSNLETVIADYIEDFTLTLPLEGTLADRVDTVSTKTKEAEITYAEDGRSATVKIPRLYDHQVLQIELTVALSDENTKKVILSPEASGAHVTGIFDESRVTGDVPLFQPAEADRRLRTATFLGGSGAPENCTEIKALPGELILTPEAREWSTPGNTFGGWKVESSSPAMYYNPNQLLVMPEDGITLTAQWGHVELELRLGDAELPQAEGNQMGRKEDPTGTLVALFQEDAPSISSIVFQDQRVAFEGTPQFGNSVTVEGATTAYYLGVNARNPVVGYLVVDENSQNTLYIAGPGGVTAPRDFSRFFSGLTGLKTVDFNNCLDTSRTEDMSYLFAYGSDTTWVSGSLSELNLRGIDMSSVKNTSNMFFGCEGLTELNVREWNMSNVTNMESMFERCRALTTLDVSNWNTGEATNMADMFNDCRALNPLDVGNWNTAKVTNMSGMFCMCHGFLSLDVENWITANVTDMSSMFRGCWVESLDVSKWNTANVTNMASMFNGCLYMETLGETNVSNWNTANVTNMASMFSACSWLRSLDVSGWDTSKVTSMNNMFYLCRWLEELNVKAWKTDNVTGMASTFESCGRLTELDVSNWNTSNVTDMSSMFHNCTQLQGLDVSNWNTSNVTNMFQMFYSCEALQTLDVSNWDTSNVTSMLYMFCDCKALRTLDVSNWKTPRVSSMNRIFSGCSALQTLGETNVGDWDTSNVTSMEYMFDSCQKLENLDVSSWDTSKVMRMPNMFYDCYSLTELDVSKWNTAMVGDMSSMFYDCSSLTSLDVTSWDTSKVTKMSNMFSSCFKLNGITFGETFYLCDGDALSMFKNCSSLTEVTGLKLKSNPSSSQAAYTSSLFCMDEMFKGCTALQTVSLPAAGGGTEFASLKILKDMFSGCTVLESVDLSGWSLPNLSKITNLFLGTGTKDLSINLAWQNLRQKNMSLLTLLLHRTGHITLEVGNYMADSPSPDHPAQMAKIMDVFKDWDTQQGGNKLTITSNGKPIYPATRSRVPARQFAYTVEYHCGDQVETVELRARLNTEVTEVEEKVFEGYTFERVEGLPLTVTADAAANVIRVYYTPDETSAEVNYTVEVYYGEERQSSETLTGTVGQEVAYAAAEIEGFQLVSMEPETLVLTEDAAANVIKVTYAAAEPEKVGYTALFYFDGSEVPDEEWTKNGAGVPGETVVYEEAAKQWAAPEGYALERVKPEKLVLHADKAENVFSVYYITPQEPEEEPPVEENSVAGTGEGAELMALSAASVVSYADPETGSGLTPIPAEELMGEDEYAMDLPTAKIATPEGSVVQYIVRIKYAGDLGAQSGRIDVSYPLPKGVKWVEGSEITVGKVETFVEGAFNSGNDKVVEEFKVESNTLTGAVSGLYAGTYMDVTVRCQIIEKTDNTEIMEGGTQYYYWDGIAYAQTRDEAVSSKFLRLWDATSPMPPETKKVPVTYEFTGDVPTSAKLPPAETRLIGETFDLPVITEPENYTFHGWKLDGEGDMRATYKIPEGTTAVKFIGRWESKAAVTVQYVFAGEDTPEDVQDYTSRLVFKDLPVGTTHSIVTLAKDAVPYYDFNGWVNVDVTNGTGPENIPLEGMLDTSGFSNGTIITYIGTWTPHWGTIKFDPNGGAGTMDDQRMKLATPDPNLNQNLFTKAGYEFQGWAKSPEDAALGIVTYYDKASTRGILTEKDQVVTLYAVWTGVRPELSIEKVVKLGGTVLPKGAEVKVGDTLTYEITVENSGSGDAVDITLADYFAAHEGAKVTWTGDDPTVESFTVVAGNTKTFTATYKVAAEDAGRTITNSAVLRGVEEPDEPQTEVKVPEEPGSDPTYTVTYRWSSAPNNAALPVDGNAYAESSTVTVSTAYQRNQTVRQGQYTYTFSGWYMDEARTERADAEFTMPDHDVILYGYWEREREPYEPDEPDPTPPTPPTPTPEPEPEPQPEPEPEPEPTPPPLPERPVDPGTGMVPYDPTVILDDLVPLAAPHLNVTDHYAYIIGYPDGMVKPLGSITRAEVATIFFRLMLDEYRQENWATENDFPDVTADKWYNNAVSTCAKAGIIKGYPDGTFRPNATITRAEFAAIAARFVSDDVPGYDYFTDMNGHWAQIDVARAVMAGWIKGEGRLFRPNDLMNRAETATLVNRMINRFPDKEHLLEGMIIWPDNPQPPMEKWFYEDIQEATNSHDYEMEELAFLEAWTYLLANRDWAALETEWANAASAPGGEVAPDLQPGGSEDSQGEEPDLSELLPGILG